MRELVGLEASLAPAGLASHRELWPCSLASWTQSFLTLAVTCLIRYWEIASARGLDERLSQEGPLFSHPTRHQQRRPLRLQSRARPEQQAKPLSRGDAASVPSPLGHLWVPCGLCVVFGTQIPVSEEAGASGPRVTHTDAGEGGLAWLCPLTGADQLILLGSLPGLPHWYPGFVRIFEQKHSLAPGTFQSKGLLKTPLTPKLKV